MDMKKKKKGMQKVCSWNSWKSAFAFWIFDPYTEVKFIKSCLVLDVLLDMKYND